MIIAGMRNLNTLTPLVAHGSLVLLAWPLTFVVWLVPQCVTVIEPASSQYEVTEAFAYDAFGNVSTDTVTGINMSPRQTTLNWTATTGQFLMSRKDASGATTQYNYNFNLGLRSGVTDPNLLTTSWTYDAFGRGQKESRPDQTYTEWAYNHCESQGGCLIAQFGAAAE